ncbi:MAG: peptidoglycan DD-metalloendopeptidase family protein [bacterium]
MAVHTHRVHSWSRLVQRGAAVAVLTAVLVALPFSLSPTGLSKHGQALAVSRSELNEKLEDTRVQIQKLRTKMAEAEKARKAALGDIVALDQSIEGLEKELRIATGARDAAAEKLAALRNQLDQVSVELARKRAQLGQTERDLQTQQEVFNTRVANVYKSGGRLIYLEALLEPSSLSQFVGRIDLLSVVVGQDNTILGQIKDLKTQVVAQRQALEEERTRVAALEQDQRALTKELQARADKRQASLERLESARKAKQQVVKKTEKDKAAWAKQEDALVAESDRIGSMLRSLSVGRSTKAGSGILAWPVDGNVTSGFGYRIHPIFHVRKMHTGIDVSAGMGTSIRAASGGTVVSAGWRGGYGKCVVISHGGGLATLYAHQSEILVTEGQSVKRGEVIGKVGSTGYSTGPHLHFEVRVNGSPVDPMGYL